MQFLFFTEFTLAILSPASEYSYVPSKITMSMSDPQLVAVKHAACFEFANSGKAAALEFLKLNPNFKPNCAIKRFLLCIQRQAKVLADFQAKEMNSLNLNT